MSVETHEHSSQPAAVPGPDRHSSPGRSICVSLLAGALTALLLTLVVFGGGTEAAITGGMLLGFGAGWALLAILTLRRTSRPQRWAAVPALGMTATGLALLALRPGNDALTSVNWLWPPVTLALAAWMSVQVRRSLAGRARWLLIAVAGVLALAAVGATYGNVALRRDLATHAPPGSLYDVGDHRLHLDCRGQGGPTVVLVNGLGGVSASWARITGPLAATTRVCAYDRAGQGWSDDAGSPQDGLAAAEDLHTLLEVAGEPGPYVLVGHSTGGTYAMGYASRHPEQVAGLVLLDSSSPEQFTRMPAYPGQYALLRRGFALLPTAHRLGLGYLLPSTSHLPAAAAEQVEALTATPRAARTVRDELSVVRDVFIRAQALGTLGGRPLAVLTASGGLDVDGWAGAQAELAELSSNRLHRTVRSSHMGLLEDPRPAAESIRAITDVVSAVRTGLPLPAR